MSEVEDLLRDILEAIEDVEEIARSGQDRFMQSRIPQAAALYRFNIVGEAVRRLPDDLKAQYPQLD